MYPLYGTFDNPEKLVFPSLRRLIFAGRSTSVMGSDDEILKRLLLPNLETLGLPLEEISGTELVSFLQRSAPPLRNLMLGGGHNTLTLPLHFPELEECIRLVPTLEGLELRRPRKSLADDLLASLAKSPLRILPSLRSLTIHSVFSRVPWDTLLLALSCRRSQLAYLKITFQPDDWHPQPGSELCAAFRELVKDGVQIHIGTEDLNILYI
ncbi:hypothetical protein DFH07DRAFT_775601 [Mycena maculata]|uniref:F-box domain-containing protein n=1 Tax=Mycena maculata TaxID=230809 RepID=A0AAD7IR61_9AGAR|nr:hypothetical protein DFH07DRAFT_775601 [Mycena maculata]